MDEWETVNDVLASYHHHPSSEKIIGAVGWDRFKFSISLGARLENRLLWLVAKYAGAGQAKGDDGVEWWDNNQGNNYRVCFRKLDDPPVEQEETEKVYKRSVVLSAPRNYPCFFLFLEPPLKTQFSDLHHTNTYLHTHSTKTISSSNIILIILPLYQPARTRKGEGESTTSSGAYSEYPGEVETFEFEKLCCS